MSKDDLKVGAKLPDGSTDAALADIPAPQNWKAAMKAEELFKKLFVADKDPTPRGLRWPTEKELDTGAKDITALQIGDVDDGGVYVGLSAENGKPLHAALADLWDHMTYDEALAAAEQLKTLHPTAHVPTPKELDKNLFDNRNTGHLSGTFNTSGSYPGRVYRSSASYS